MVRHQIRLVRDEGHCGWLDGASFNRWMGGHCACIKSESLLCLEADLASNKTSSAHGLELTCREPCLSAWQRSSLSI